MRSALGELGYEPPGARVEELAFLVFDAMTGHSRDYHGVGHVFAVASGLPALGRLAAAYHDTVYRQIDGGWLPAIGEKLGGSIRIDDKSGMDVTLAARLDDAAADVAAIFGYDPGRRIRLQDGLNEFLSALLAVRELEGILTRRELWTIAACIEATIPFRGRDAQNRTVPEAIRDRVAALAARRRERLSAAHVSGMVRLAVRVANSDVQSFAQADVGAFLDDTWKLLPESHPELNNSASYSIRSYSTALIKTEGFLSSLDPARIFQQFGGVPATRVYGLLQGRAHANLGKGCEYLRAKIVTVSIIMALAELTGGDAPVSYFTGSVESGEAMAHSMLPEDEAVPEQGFPAIDPMVLYVLRHGRLSDASFDTTQSPLSAHLYETIGSAGIQAHTARAKQVYAGQHDWRWYLDGFPPRLIAEIAHAVSHLAHERADALNALVKADAIKTKPKAA
jgi:hypothetical protein